MKAKELIKFVEGDKVILGRWESTRGKHWVELYKDSLGYTYQSNNGGGNMGSLPDDQTAIKQLEDKINSGYFLPDVAKNPMKRSK